MKGSVAVEGLILWKNRPIRSWRPVNGVNFRGAVKNSTLRILIVEDEPLIRWSIAETLTQSGHTVLETDSAEGAVRELQDGPDRIDVVLLDLRLPDSDDFTLLDAVRRLTPASPVILMTAHGTPDIARDALAHGACRVMHKPFDMQEIALAVTEVHDKERPHGH